MKKILLLLTLITFSAFAQNPDYHRYGVRTPFTKYISYTTSQRDALTPSSTDRTIIHHKDTGINRLEQWDGDSWEELVGGAVDSVQGLTGNVVITPDDLDDFSTLNKFVTQEEKELIFTALQTETDPIFTAWDKDYNDLINKPTIPSASDNIYNTDGTLEGDRSINIAEHSLSVKDSLGVPLFNVSNDGISLLAKHEGVIRGALFSQPESIEGSYSIGILGGNGIAASGGIGVTTTPTYSESSISGNLVVIKADSLKIRIIGEIPEIGQILVAKDTLGTVEWQTPSGGGGTDDQTAAEVPFTPYSTISATNVQDAIEEIKDELDALPVPAAPNLTYETLTYTASQTVSHDALRPNKVVTTTGNWSLTLDDVYSGVSGKLLIKSTDGHQIKLNGATGIDFTSQGDDVLAFYEVDSTGDIHWRTADPVTKELTSDGDTTISFESDNYYLTLSDVDDLISLETPTFPKEITLTIHQGATTPTDILFENNLMIAGGVMPTLTQTVDAVDIWKIKYDNGKFYVTSITEDYSNVAGTAPLVLTPIIRVNLGGSAITATDGEIDWQSGTGTSGTSWGVSGGVTSTSAAGITWTRHASIPSSIPDADFQTVFDSSRYTSTNQTFTFTVANGDYEVQIFTGEQIGSGTGVTFDITIEGNLVEDDGYLPTIFGYQTAGMLSYPVTVSDGNITVLCTKISGSANFFIHGIQIVE